jgi:hypothetical protein
MYKIGRFACQKLNSGRILRAIESNPRKALFMPSLRMNGVALCSAIFLSVLPLACQTSTFHLERVAAPAGLLGDGTLVLVNDSDKLISVEAFHLVQRCEGGGFWGSTDFFVNRKSVGTKPILREGVTIWPDAIEIDAKGRFETGIGFEVLRNAKGIVERCEHQMDAALFTDGTHVGSEGAVRSLKAHRDGISDRVRYWVNRLSLENRDGSGIDAMREEAECFLNEDREKSGEHGSDFFKYALEPVLDSYREGRWFVDEKVLKYFDPGERSQALTFHQLSLQIMSWKEGIASHPSSKSLDIEFPPISEPTGTCGSEPKSAE